MGQPGKELAHAVDIKFRTTGYAEHLKKSPRWSSYTPDQMSPVRWRELLHADSDGLDQTRLMIRLTDLYLEYDTDNSSNLDDNDRRLLFLATSIQNWGKSFDDEHSKGKDVRYELITANEVEHRKRKMHMLIDELLPDLDIKDRYIVERTIYDKDTRLGNVFDAIRRLNCLRTGLIAYDEYLHDPLNPEVKNLAALTLGVMANQLPYLVTYAERYTPVRLMLESNKDRIDEIFNNKVIRDLDMVSTQQAVESIGRSEMIWSRSHGELPTHDINARGPRHDTLFSTNSQFERRFFDDKNELQKVIESLRTLGMRITLTSGSFDLLHVGHAKYLERASAFGDVLVVGVDSDAKIKKRKGPSRPIVGETERVKLLSHIRGVDILTLKDQNEERWGLIKLIRPDTLVVTAETYTAQEVKELEQQYCGRVVVLEPQATTSTGAQIRRIQTGEHTALNQAIEDVMKKPDTDPKVRNALTEIAMKLGGYAK